MQRHVPSKCQLYDELGVSTESPCSSVTMCSPLCPCQQTAADMVMHPTDPRLLAHHTPPAGHAQYPSCVLAGLGMGDPRLHHGWHQSCNTEPTGHQAESSRRRAGGHCSSHGSGIVRLRNSCCTPCTRSAPTAEHLIDTHACFSFGTKHEHYNIKLIDH